MRFSVVRCDHCRKDEWIVFPKRYPAAWMQKVVNEKETWDLCPSCQDEAIANPPVRTFGHTTRDLVTKLLAAFPLSTDQQLADEAGRWGVQISGETVRRHRKALDVPKVAKRRKSGTGSRGTKLSKRRQALAIASPKAGR